MIGSHVARLILYKSFVVCISNRDQRCLRQKNALSQRLQRKTSDFARKGELLSTNSDQIKTHNDCINILFVYDTFYDQKNLKKKKCYPRPST